MDRRIIDLCEVVLSTLHKEKQADSSCRIPEKLRVWNQQAYRSQG